MLPIIFSIVKVPQKEPFMAMLAFLWTLWFIKRLFIEELYKNEIGVSKT